MYSQSPTKSLADIALPTAQGWPGIARDAALILSFTLLIALFARFSIHLPFTPVPVTGQTFAVLLTGAALGSWRSAASAALYLLAGTLLPIYAGSADSYLWDANLGALTLGFTAGNAAPFWTLASGGYIIGFIPAAYLIGFLAERGLGNSIWILPTLLAGNILIYIPGLIQLSLFAPEGKTLEWGLYPFIAGDLLKLLLAAMLVPAAWSLANHWRGDNPDNPRRHEPRHDRNPRRRGRWL